MPDVEKNTFQPDDTNLCFGDNRTSATLITVAQRVTATVNIGATISFLAETFSRQVEQRYSRTTLRVDIFLIYRTLLKTDSAFTCPVQFGKV